MQHTRYICHEAWQSDTSTTTSIDDATQSELVKELRNGKVAENNDVHAAIFHLGKDDRVRHLCGPRINSLINRPTINSVVHALHSRNVIDKLMHGCIV